MESAGRILTRLRAARQSLPLTQLVGAAWPSAVGERLAKRTWIQSLYKGSLVVEVEDALWQRNLQALTPQIRSNLTRLLGDVAPQAIEFRIGVRRRPPHREEPARTATLLADESSRIADPVLEHIYRVSRRKAGA